MRQKQSIFSLFLLSPSSRRAWIEITRRRVCSTSRPPSPSSRRAWIEICCWQRRPSFSRVALLAEGVDRNVLRVVLLAADPLVALLAEGVDRNNVDATYYINRSVALLAEGVDRNYSLQIHSA